MQIRWRATNGRKRDVDIRDSCDRLVLDIRAGTQKEAERLSEIWKQLNRICASDHCVVVDVRIVSSDEEELQPDKTEERSEQ